MSQTPEAPLRIGISSCLLGERVRYDGGHKRHAHLADVLAPHLEFVPVCPEMGIGLGTPRPPMHLEGRDGDPASRLVVTSTGADLTDSMAAFATATIRDRVRLSNGNSSTTWKSGPTA